MEVDLCLGQEWALKEENLFDNYGVICFEKHKRIIDGITIWPWEEFLNQL